jgi:RNA polymerase sigma-70 factor (ECF subfamily)
MDESKREQRLRELYVAHAQQVLSYALRRGASRPDAEDLVIETFLTLWRRLDELADPGLPWLLAAARRLLANQRRSASRRLALERKIMSVEQSSSTEGASLVDDPSLARALARLDEEDREVLLLTAWEGLTQKEVGQVLGCSRRTVMARLKRARTNLARFLEDEAALPEPSRTEEVVTPDSNNLPTLDE